MPQILGVPDVVWSGVIASGITLFGVWLSNKGNSERLRIQLENDAEEKVKQRKAELRKMVYLDFVEESVKANIVLSTLPDIDMAKNNPAEGLVCFNSASAKVQLISKIETAEAVGDLQVKFATLSVRMMSKAHKISNIKSKIEIHNNLYEAASREVQRILAEMTAFNEAARKDRDVFDALSRSFEFQRNLAARYASERNDLWRERNSLHIEYTRFLAAEMIKIKEDAEKAMILVRSELELEEDADNVEERMRMRSIEYQKAIQSVLEEALSGINGENQLPQTTSSRDM